MNILRFGLFLSAFAWFSVVTATQPAAFERYLREQMAEVIEEKSLPAGAVAILRTGQQPWIATFREPQLQQQAVTQDTRFHIASVSKTMVAAIAVQLAAVNKIDLDAFIAAHLPTSVAALHGGRIGKLTLRQLLSHQAGLPQDQAQRKNLQRSEWPPDFDPTIPDPSGFTVDEFYTALKRTEFEYPAGERHSYSNLGFHLAGHVMERATGRSLESLIQQYVFQPLKMIQAVIVIDKTIESTLATPYAYFEQEDRLIQIPAWQQNAIWGAWGVTATIADMARYVDGMLTPTQAREWLGASAEAQLLTPQVEYLREPETVYQQALGWRMSVFGDYGLIYRHNGHADGHHAFVAFSRQYGLGLVLLVSGDHDRMESLGNQLLLKLLQDARQNSVRQGLSAK
jgi:CubicO group peptidase (beta-lactamase class C family)